MASDRRLVLPLIETADLSDEDMKLVKTILWRDGATPAIASAAQYVRYQRIVAALFRKYDAETRSSLSFIRSPDGVLLTSLEARMLAWDEQTAASS